MKRTVVWLTDQQIEELGRMSKRSLAPISALVRQAVKSFLHQKRNRRGRKAAKRLPRLSTIEVPEPAETPAIGRLWCCGLEAHVLREAGPTNPAIRVLATDSQ